MTAASLAMEAEAKRESAVGVLGVLAGLAVLAALLLVTLRSQGTEVDGEALARRVFTADPWPAGLSVRGAARLETGESLVVLERPGEAREGDPWPETLALVLPTRPGAVSELFSAGPSRFGGGPGHGPPGEGFGGGPPGFGTGPLVIGRGALEWGGWRAAYVHERRFETPEGPAPAPPDAGRPPRGPARDTIRVNLSAASRLAVLHATWPEGVPASKEVLADLLERLQVAEPESAVP